jgi:hypothetical protein
MKTRMKRLLIRMYMDGVPNANFGKKNNPAQAYDWKISSCMFELFQELKPTFGEQVPELPIGILGPEGFSSIILRIHNPWEEVLLRVAAAKYQIPVEECK